MSHWMLFILFNHFTCSPHISPRKCAIGSRSGRLIGRIRLRERMDRRCDHPIHPQGQLRGLATDDHSVVGLDPVANSSVFPPPPFTDDAFPPPFWTDTAFMSCFCHFTNPFLSPIVPLMRLPLLAALCAFLVALFGRFASGEFKPHFSHWLAQRFGEDVRNNLERRDLGIWGSFGGRTVAEEPIGNQPVVFVHGVSNRACDKMKQSADFFFNHGYTFAELYGTTYANGDQGNPLQWAAYSMKCQYVKLVRALIVAVRLYTGKQVDVVGYSLGVPVSRKAILGGICVDTGEDLGGSLTKFVDTFIGVAGPNHGISLQVGALSVPGCLLSVLPVCNAQTGLYSGFCPAESAFLQDINRQQAYEGQNRFSIYSTRDQVVGHQVCGQVTSRLPGQHGEKVYDNADHDGAFLHTFPVQHAMVLHHMII